MNNCSSTLTSEHWLLMSRSWFWAESSSSTKSCSSRACFFALFWDSSQVSCRQHQSIVSTGSRAKAAGRARWNLQGGQEGWKV